MIVTAALRLVGYSAGRPGGSSCRYHPLVRTYGPGVRLGLLLGILSVGSGCSKFSLSPFSPTDADERRLPRTGLRVLVVGNSVTLTPPDALIGWDGNWGASASSADRDYAHRIIAHFATETGDTPDVRIIRTSFETAFASLSDCSLIDSTGQLGAWHPDLAIVRIGDNVVESVARGEGFTAKYCGALKKLKRGDSCAVITTSSWFPNLRVDVYMREACTEANVWYVPIAGLYYDADNRANSERNFSNDFLGRHPGDRGMAAIARTLWDVISELLQ